MNDFTPKDWFVPHAAAIGRMMGSTKERNAQEMNVEVLKRTDIKMILRVKAGGSIRLVKAYNSQNSIAQRRFEREIGSLLALRGRHLTAPLRGFNRQELFFVCDEISGQTAWQALANGKDPVGTANRIGKWLAEFDGQIAPQAISTNWLDYLNRYDAVSSAHLGAGHRDFLANLSINQMAIARNDAHFSNFIFGTNDRTVGVDFEAAALKPIGWDLLLASRFIAKHWPSAFEPMLDALVAPWDNAKFDQKELRSLATIFSLLTGFRHIGSNQPRADLYLQNFNRQAKRKATASVIVPYAAKELTSPPFGQIQKLRNHILSTGVRARLHKTESSNNDALYKERPPDQHTLALCATCAGKCCTRGLEKYAFLEASDIARQLAIDRRKTAKSIADRYLAFIPQSHVSGSCLFHSDTGCALPRDMRSNTCNQYLCAPQKSFGARTTATGKNPVPLLIVASEGTDPNRANVLVGDSVEAVDLEFLVKPKEP